MDHSESSFNAAHVEGYENPEDAVRAFEASVRQAAIPRAEFKEVSEEAFNEMVDLLAPSRSFRTTDSRAVTSDSSTIHYFDKPSDTDGVLEARIVVGQVTGQWVVLEAFRCESTIVSDFERFKELRIQETSQ